jgi:hypothetical protein
MHPWAQSEPRIACLRLSRTLVYLYRRELEPVPVRLPAVPCIAGGNTVSRVKLAQQASRKLLQINVPAWRNWQTR